MYVRERKISSDWTNRTPESIVGYGRFTITVACGCVFRDIDNTLCPIQAALYYTETEFVYSESVNLVRTTAQPL